MSGSSSSSCYNINPQIFTINDDDIFSSFRPSCIISAMICETSQVKGLYFPLVCLLEYRGFRVIANSVLPIKDTTLKYGSKDAGKSVLKVDKKLNKKMKKAAMRINLAGHNVIHNGGNKVTKVSFPSLPPPSSNQSS